MNRYKVILDPPNQFTDFNEEIVIKAESVKKISEKVILADTVEIEFEGNVLNILQIDDYGNP